MATHRAEQILQAAKDAIEAQPDVGAGVFAHRTLTVAALDQELPAVCVNMGPDSATDETGYSNLNFVDSSLRVDVSLYAQGVTQQEVATELLRLRSVTHRALLASPRDLGLTDFVMGISYGGAEKPAFTDAGSPLAGRMDCTFSILYRMNLADPD